METRNAGTNGSPDRLMRTAEAAELLSISERKLWELTNRKDIPHLRIGRAVRYRWLDLLQWIEKQIEGGC